MDGLILIAVLAALALMAILGWRVRAARIAVDPARWPAELTQDQEVRYVEKLLRRAGWAYAPPAEWMNVFVRGVKNQKWVSLLIHGKHSLGMPFLIRDAMEKSLGTGWNIGLVTRDFVHPSLIEEATRGGIFVINPAQLVDLDRIVAELEARRAKARADIEAELARTPTPVSTPEH